MEVDKVCVCASQDEQSIERAADRDSHVCAKKKLSFSDIRAGVKEVRDGEETWLKRNHPPNFRWHASPIYRLIR